jgi:hypothetical protein
LKLSAAHPPMTLVLQGACQFRKMADFRHSGPVNLKFTPISVAPNWDFAPTIGGTL